MDNFDTLVSRIERIELPPDTRDKHLARISQAMLQPGPPTAATSLDAIDAPARRSHRVPATVLAAAAVAAIVAGAWLAFTPDRPTATTMPAASSSAPSSQAPKASTEPEEGFNVLTAPGTAAELAGLLDISATDARASLTRLAALAEGTGGALDPANAQFLAIAADLGVTPAALDNALKRIKFAAVAADPSLARKTAIHENTQPKARGATDTGSDLLTTPETAAKLATLLHVSPTAAKAGLAKIAALARQNDGIDPTTPAFGDIATSLGSTPSDLDAALARIKASAGNDYSADKTAKPVKSADSAKSTGKPAGSSTGDSDLLTAPATAARLAQLLDITPAAARAGLSQLETLAQHSGGGLSPKSQQFRDIAADLHITPSALNEALGRIKANS